MAGDSVVLSNAWEQADGGAAAHGKEHDQCVGNGPPAEERGFELVPDTAERLFDSLFQLLRLLRSGERSEGRKCDEGGGDPAERRILS